MRNIRLLTAVVFVFALALGVIMVTTPQAVLKLGWSSGQLGLIGAFAPLGYALSCLVCGRFSRATGKHLLLFGVGLGICATTACYFLFARSPAWAVAARQAVPPR